jgi:hypothetical protein
VLGLDLDQFNGSRLLRPSGRLLKWLAGEVHGVQSCLPDQIMYGPAALFCNPDVVMHCFAMCVICNPLRNGHAVCKIQQHCNLARSCLSAVPTVGLLASVGWLQPKAG